MSQPVDVSGFVARALDILDAQFERDACLEYAALCERLGDEGRSLRLLLEAGAWQRYLEARTA